VFPAAIAIGCIHIGTMTGKLNGVMPAHTPSGWRNEYASTSVETWSEYSPLRSCGRPHAYSTTSWPRITSPLASENTFPCSEDTIRASSSTCCATSSRKRNITRARRVSETSCQVSNAARAALTARSTSRASARITSACRRPVAGSNTGAVRPELPGFSSPAIRWAMVLMVVVVVVLMRCSPFLGY
jgi:disulfide bond formation protein DsbB